MASIEGQRAQQPTTPTVNPQALSKNHPNHNPRQSKRFNPEEWENWMQWDGATESLSPKSHSNSSSPSLHGGTSGSQGSTMPSETESLPILPLTPIYRIPSFDADHKTPAPTGETRRPASKKRKTSGHADVQSTQTRTRQPKGQKISHNVIEKRYRTNLNDKIARLRDSVPVLKSAFESTQKQANRDAGVDSGSDSGSDDKGETSGLKFNKATVLTKATEYIEQLERANARLMTENSTLRRRTKDDNHDPNAPRPLYFRADEATATGSALPNQLKADIEQSSGLVSPISPDQVSGKIPMAPGFERLRAEAADRPSYAPVVPVPEPLSPSPTARAPESAPSTPVAPGAAAPSGSELIDFDSVKGAIPLPDYIRRARIPISQQAHYAPSLHPRGRSYNDPASDSFALDDDEVQPWWPRNRASKLLLGSLAGLMIMEGLSTNVDTTTPQQKQKYQGHHKRGLAFLPDEFYTESRGFRAQIRQRIIDFAHSPQARKALPVLALAAVILGVVMLALLYWSRNDPRARRRANSVSSNPERDAVEEVGQVSKSDGLLPPLYGLDRPGETDEDTRWLEKRELWTEAVARLRACWRILTEGDGAVEPRRERATYHGLVPQILVTGQKAG